MRLSLTIIVAALAGCATPSAPPWLAERHEIVPIRWVRVADRPLAEVRDGACVLHLADTERDRNLAHSLVVSGCLARGGLVPGSGDMDVHWYTARSLADLWQRRDSLYPPTPAMPSLGTRPAITARQGEHLGSITGFFSRPNSKSPCTVVSLRNSPQTFGHELKHCYDGFWHV